VIHTYVEAHMSVFITAVLVALTVSSRQTIGDALLAAHTDAHTR
jgi:hypothetical protein